MIQFDQVATIYKTAHFSHVWEVITPEGSVVDRGWTPLVILASRRIRQLHNPEIPIRVVE